MSLSMSLSMSLFRPRRSPSRSPNGSPGPTPDRRRRPALAGVAAAALVGASALLAGATATATAAGGAANGDYVGTFVAQASPEPDLLSWHHVYAAQSGTTVTPFVRDKNYSPTSVGSVTLPAGQWTTVTWTVPSVASVGAIGLDASPGTGTVSLDALTRPTS